MILEQPLAFVDVETTGTDCSIHEIIELGVVITKLKDDTLTVIDKIDVKIKPSNIENAEPAALRINGYNESDWLFATSLEDAMRIFSEKTAGAVFVAHNVTFDWGFVEQAFRTTKVENRLHFHKLDTIAIAFTLNKNNEDMNKLSLRRLCEYYLVENNKAHSAFADAYATYELFKKMLNLK